MLTKNGVIVLQGDSITDAGRDRSDIHNLGHGYPFYAAELIKEKYPESEVAIGYTGTVIGAHSGPGTLALFFLGTAR